MTTVRRALTVLAALAVVAMTPAPAEAHRRPHCRSDDAAPPWPCVWDAHHMGNGWGISFKVAPGGQVFYLDHPRAHHLAYGSH